eukprot:CAMPEP_0206434484 /NCGR_PEP_ID=MMETSP0324_2-20121206/9198_1 /ASSEMBLY_ACC=CAM_ASM_000836 /TAXON_ID=2866 /ORGANISM="Crypthecodinium cohnii, Strain Seligo" /LENGTH=356 /DNA_ID=CAMNT_0053901033 /DNA_START=41 /DNA_END=1111 /DNA_ORIENTATION=-
MSNLAQSEPKAKCCKDKNALRAALDKNPILCLLPAIRRKPQPTYPERLWLFVLYLSTGLLVEHVALLWGPICRQAYRSQCPLDPFQVNSTSGIRSAEPTEVEGVIEGGDNGGEQLLAMELGSTREAIVKLASGHVPELDCNMTQCDHWESLRVSEGDSTLDDGEYLTFLYLPGVCRCSENWAQKVTYRLSAAAVSIVLQTAFYTFSYTILSTNWDQREGFFAMLQKIFVTSMTLVMIGQIVVIYLIRFMPDAWMISLIVSCLSVVTVSFVIAFVSAHLGITRIDPSLLDSANNDPDFLTMSCTGPNEAEARTALIGPETINDGYDSTEEEPPARGMFCCSRKSPPSNRDCCMTSPS